MPSAICIIIVSEQLSRNIILTNQKSLKVSIGLLRTRLLSNLVSHEYCFHSLLG